MNHGVSVRTYIGLNLIHTVDIVAGWSGQHNKIERIVSREKLLRGHHDDAVACKMEALSAELFALRPSAIFICGNPEMVVDSTLVAKADQERIPLILLRVHSDAPELNEILQFSLKLQVKFKAAEYKNINFLLGKFEQYPEQSICDLLSMYFTADVVLLDQEFEQIDECNCAFDIRYKLQAIDCIAQWYHEQKPEREKEFLIENAYVFALPLFCRQVLIGYLTILGLKVQVDAVDIQVIRQMGYFGLQSLLLQKEIEEVKHRYKNDFVYDLLYNNFKLGYDLVDVFRHWGIDFAKQHQLVVVQPDKVINKEKQTQILQEIERVGDYFFEMESYQLISIVLHEQVIFIFNCKNDEYRKPAIKALAEKLKAFLNDQIKLMTVSIGIGRFYAGMREVYKGYEEAKQALILAGFAKAKDKVSHFEDLGIMALLAQLDKEKLNDYNQVVIGKLIQYDKINETNHLRLLQVYFEHSNNLNATAETLFMHANTVRNHLKKIEEILDVDLQNFNDCLQIYIACKTYDIVNLR